jgi:hypothetical protein
MRKTMPFPRRPAPALALVRQAVPTHELSDVRAYTRECTLKGLTGQVRPGNTIAITAGSRGMGGLVELLAGICDAVSDLGGKPFILPSMGSHGGAIAEAQREILERLGITPPNVGASIHAGMDTIVLGKAETGATIHLDKCAAEADGIIVLGRVKTHPQSATGLASGLLKMITVGLGKQAGAFEAHSHGLWESVRTVPKIVLEKAKIVLGIAVVESARRKPVVVEAFAPNYDAFLEADKRLLRVAQQNLLKIPFEQLDVLILDEIGKTISGSGMDLNVVGSWRVGCGPKVPDYHRIVVLSLTPESLGNGIGIGLADFTTRRFEQEFDQNVTYVNILTATERDSNPREGSLPLVLNSDREAIEVAMLSSLASERPRVCRARNTAVLEELWVSEALLEESTQKGLKIVGPPAPLPYNESGNLW